MSFINFLKEAFGSVLVGEPETTDFQMGDEVNVSKMNSIGKIMGRMRYADKLGKKAYKVLVKDKEVVLYDDEIKRI